MNLKHFIRGVLACFAIPFAANAEISYSADGLLQVEKLKFGIAFWEKNFKFSASQLLRPKTVTFPGEEAIQTKDGSRRDGTFRLSDELEFHFAETTRRISENELEQKLELTSNAGISTAILCRHTMMPDAWYAENPAIFNGVPLPCPKQKQLVYGKSHKKDELILNLQQGSLKITGAFDLTVRRNEWGFTELRLSFPKSWGVIRRAELKQHLLYTPYRSQTLDLRGAVNMGFLDEYPDDRKGGWTDQGPGNDLRAMKPGLREFFGIPFDLIDPASNRGFSVLAIQGKHRPYFLPQAKIALNGVSGRYLYLLNGVAWASADGTPCGAVRIAYADGTSFTHELIAGTDTGNFWNPRRMKNATVVWRNSEGEAQIGLYATKIPLDPNRTPVSLEFLSRDQVWMIPAATVSNRTPAKGKDEVRTVMRAGRDWKAVNFGFLTVPGSVADLSGLVKAGAPAGKYGFLKVVGDHFEFEKQPGVRVRFWGKIMGFTTLFMSEKETLEMLDDAVALGTNSIRFHHFDYALTKGRFERGTFEPENLRKLDFLLAESKKRGIYITLDLFTYRHFDAMKRLGNPSTIDYKVLCYFDPRARAELLGFARELFGRVNPYTGLAWKDDPAVVTVNLVNEGPLYACEPNGKRLFQVPFQYEPGKLRFTAANDGGEGILLYELVRNEP